MNIEEALYTKLSGDAGVSALVSTRIAALLLPQNMKLPAITYFRVSSTRFSAMGVDSSVVKARFQIDVWADTHTGVVALKNAVRAALNRWSTTSGITVFDTFMLSEVDLYEDDIKQHHIAIDFEINYNED